MTVTKSLTCATGRRLVHARAAGGRTPNRSMALQGVQGMAAPNTESFFQQQTEQQQSYFHRNQYQYKYHSTLAAASNHFVPFPIPNLRDDNNNHRDGRIERQQYQQQQQQILLHHPPQQRRSFHSTPTPERAAAIMLGLASVSALAFAASSAVQSYNEWKAGQPTPEELEAMRQEEEKRQQTTATQKEEPKSSTTSSQDDRPRENIFRQWFDVGSKYYEGGFEDSMTKREAALILGVRESSSPSRIKEAHRKLLILNHPDTGGSTYVAGKINEAKELLLKGKQRI